MRKIALVFYCFSGLALNTQSQEQLPAFFIQFSDKNNTPYSLNQASEFLSERAIQRRARQNIALEFSDLPVDPSYIAAVDAIVGLRVRYASKWLNGVVVESETEVLPQELDDLSFVVSSVQLRLERGNDFNKDLLPAFDDRSDSPLPLSITGNIYGPSFPQIALHRGELMHEAGFRGQGIQIAVIDAGFTLTDSLVVFGKLRDEGRILGTRDFVDDDEFVYEGSQHGTIILSTLAGYMPDAIIGTAPAASFWLLRSEDSSSESPIEECNWIAAAEFADSVGVDILTTSLGYSLFNDSTLNYTPLDMNGQTSLISVAAGMAADKGLLVLNSAGNSGSSPWRSITAPADAKGIIAVGAINDQGEHAPFSGYGPSTDGRIKPEVMAVGWQTTFADLAGGISKGNGTSFSCPIMAGLAACLWQAHPNESAASIRDAILKSANLFYHPNDSMGYGIPDFWSAHRMLSDISGNGADQFRINTYPNPFKDYITIAIEGVESEGLELTVYDLSGNAVIHPHEFLFSGGTAVRNLYLGNLAAGVYFLELRYEGSRQVTLIQKAE